MIIITSRWSYLSTWQSGKSRMRMLIKRCKETATCITSQPANLTTYTILSLFSLQVEPAPHLLSPYLDHLYLHHYKSPTAPLDMHHLTCGINSPFHSVNVIVFTDFHSPPGSPHPTHITLSQSSPSFSPSVTLSTFHSRLKTHLFHKSFPP